MHSHIVKIIYLYPIYFYEIVFSITFMKSDFQRVTRFTYNLFKCFIHIQDKTFKAGIEGISII